MLELLFNEVIEEFFSYEGENIINGTSERNLCSRLAIYMERIKDKYGLSNYYADAEYNRNLNGRLKTILNDNMEVITINCDLILHSRGEIVERDNLIAIEMKKSERPRNEKEDDRNRLRALTKESYDGIWTFDGKSLPEHVCGYEVGYFIEIDIRNRKYRIQTFERGELVKEVEYSF